MLSTLLCVAMPCALVILSLWRIAKTAVRHGTAADKLWVCVYSALNAFSALWCAKVLSTLAEGELPPELVRASLTVGLAIFAVFLLALFARDITKVFADCAMRLAKFCRFARRKR